tara:strand:+ start:85 stop:261 length:177 start_codon:yes stop_codon:yes gene_type:complete
MLSPTYRAQQSNIVKPLILLLILTFVTSCGTARGVLYGTGTVLEGMATDARSVGNWIK